MYDQSVIHIPKGQYLDRDYYIGAQHPPFLNASIGTSSANHPFETELEKAAMAIAAGADMVTDHSIHGNVPEFHKILRSRICKPLGAVPIYELALRSPRFPLQEALEFLEEYLERGFNVLTLHATALEADVQHPLSQHRIIPITSKGGRLMLERMAMVKSENPFFSHFDDVLKIFKKHSAVISLGPTYRQASVADNSMEDSDAYWVEMRRISALVEKAIAAEVPVIVEGIGHACVTSIAPIIQKTKALCFGVPYRALTVSTDIALGYDHISSAIADTFAVLGGADVITAVSAAEHVGHPSVQQVEDAVVAARIAIHSAGICLGRGIEQDARMSSSRARRESCQGSIQDAIFREGALRALEGNKQEEGCTMCGELCALRRKKHGT